MNNCCPLTPLQAAKLGQSAVGLLPLTSAFIAQFGITDAVIINAVNEIEKNIKGVAGASVNTTYDFVTDGNLGYLYLMRGATEASCEWDFLSNSFPLTFFNAPTFNADGVVLDGAVDYGTTGWVASAELADEKSGWVMYAKGIGAGTYAIGAAQDPNKYNTYALVYNPTTSTSELSDAGGAPTTADTNADGVRGAFRIDVSNIIYQTLNVTGGGARAFGANPAIQDVIGGGNYNTDGNIIAHKAYTCVVIARLKGSINATKLTVLKNVLNQFVTDLGI